MAKKKDKAAQAAKKQRATAKAEKISVKKDKKSSSKPGKDDDSDAESDVDLDAVLASYAAQQEQFLKVTETVCEPPSARSSATFLANPSNGNELFLFGGEHFNGSLARFYNDLFVYNITRDEWKLVTSPNSPLPRSGHAWCRGGNQGGLWMFGGEFSSPKQGTFYHYGDFWRFEEKSREWTRVETKKGPPGRSGHRMTYFKVSGIRSLVVSGWSCQRRVNTNVIIEVGLTLNSNISSSSAASKTLLQPPNTYQTFGSTIVTTLIGINLFYRPPHRNQTHAPLSHSYHTNPGPYFTADTAVSNPLLVQQNKREAGQALPQVVLVL